MISPTESDDARFERLFLELKTAREDLPDSMRVEIDRTLDMAQNCRNELNDNLSAIRQDLAPDACQAARDAYESGLQELNEALRETRDELLRNQDELT